MIIAFLWCAVACLACLERPRFAWLVLGWGSLFYAVGARYNAVVAGLALVPVLVRAAARWSERAGRLAALRDPAAGPAIGMGLFAALVLLAYVVNVVGKPIGAVSVLTSVYAWDLAAASVEKNELLVPRALVRDQTLDDAAVLALVYEAFRPEVSVPLFAVLRTHGANEQRTREIARAGRHAWFGMLRDAPGAYLRHRGQLALRLLGLHDSGVRYAYQRGIDPNDLGLGLEPFGPRVRAFEFADRRVRGPWFFRAWMHLLIAITVLGVVGRRILSGDPRDDHAVLAAWLAVSAIVYIVPFFVFAPAAAFRYSLWLVLGAFAALALVLADRTRARES